MKNSIFWYYLYWNFMYKCSWYSFKVIISWTFEYMLIKITQIYVSLIWFLSSYWKSIHVNHKWNLDFVKLRKWDKHNIVTKKKLLGSLAFKYNLVFTYQKINFVPLKLNLGVHPSAQVWIINHACSLVWIQIMGASLLLLLFG